MSSINNDKILAVKEKISKLEKELAAAREELSKEELSLNDMSSYLELIPTYLQSTCVKQQAAWLATTLCCVVTNIPYVVVDHYHFRKLLRDLVLKNLNISNLDEANDFLEKLHESSWKSELDKTAVSKLATKLLWLMFCWNDHNFRKSVSEYASESVKANLAVFLTLTEDFIQ